ncbi:MAG: hypothetical protein KC766_17775, partial [Myxococcales bacterium]|nr:hypothetical protein [Myxococcales bacterium]
PQFPSVTRSQPGTLDPQDALGLGENLLIDRFTLLLKTLGSRAGCSYQSIACPDLEVGHPPPATPDAVR